MTKSTGLLAFLVVGERRHADVERAALIDGMILSKSASRYSAVKPRVAAIAFIKSTSKPTILPLESLNSLGV